MRAAAGLALALAVWGCAPAGGDGAAQDARVVGGADGQVVDALVSRDAGADAQLDDGGALDGGQPDGAAPDAATDQGLDQGAVDAAPLDGTPGPDAGHGDATAPDAGPPEVCPGAPSPLEVPVNAQGRWRFVDAFPTEQPGLRARGLRIYLPAAYDAEPERRFPVLYMHDGQNLYDGRDASFGVAWEVDDTVDDLTARGVIEPVIVVGVDNTPDRTSDYTPSSDPDWGGAGNAAAYGRFLVHELKPWIDTHLRTRCGRADTAVAGSSLGGLVSLFLLKTHPQVFGRVGSFSPSLWWNGREALGWAGELADALGDDGRLWIDGGNRERGGDDDLDGRRSVLANTHTLTRALLAQGVAPLAGLGYLESNTDQHDEAAWARRLPVALAWLLAGPPQGAPQAVEVRPFTSFLTPAGPRAVAVDAAWPDHRLTLPDDAPQWAVAGAAQVVDGQATAQAAQGSATLTATWRGVQGSAELDLAPNAALIFRVRAPFGTDEGQPLWLAGERVELGDWIPAHGLRLDPQGDGVWAAPVALPAGLRVEFKITRGSWATVEKGAGGEELANRALVPADGEVIELTVARWADWN